MGTSLDVHKINIVLGLKLWYNRRRLWMKVWWLNGCESFPCFRSRVFIIYIPVCISSVPCIPLLYYWDECAWIKRRQWDVEKSKFDPYGFILIRIYDDSFDLRIFRVVFCTVFHTIWIRDPTFRIHSDYFLRICYYWRIQLWFFNERPEDNFQE